MNLPLAAAFWAVMVVIAIANGIFGEQVVAKAFGAYASHLYKTAVIIAVIFFFSRVYLKWAVPAGYAGGAPYTYAVSAGLLWLASSILFEFFAGHYIFGFSWERLFADYRITKGRVWILVLASEVVGPLVNAYLMRGRWQ